MTKKRRRESSTRQKTRIKRHKRSMVLVSAVVLLLTVVVFASSMSLQAKNKEYKIQEAELTGKIQDEKARTEEITKFREYVTTDDYVKEIAEERLGLVNPNEIIFRPAE